MRLLLRADPTVIDSHGLHDPPALGRAARGGHAATVDLLLEAGANPRGTVDDLTARDLAANADIRERLRSAMLNGNPRPRRRPLENTAALARLLASEGLDSPRLPAAGPTGGMRPLHHAVGASAIAVVELLLDAGAELLDYEVPAGWRTVAPLAEARRRDADRRVASGLATRHVSLGVELRDFVDGLGGGMGDIDWRNASEAQVLEWFASRPHEVNAHYVDALTPLHMASAFDMPDVVTALIRHGGLLGEAD